MASLSELSERLLKRFKGVPNYELDDATVAVEDAMLTLGYAAADDVPNDKIARVLLLAQSDSAYNIAFSVAHYFSYTDGEESVNKSTVSDKYLALAKALRERYDDEAAGEDKAGHSSFAIAKRADRDFPLRDQWWVGNSLARPWWR